MRRRRAHCRSSARGKSCQSLGSSHWHFGKFSSFPKVLCDDPSIIPCCQLMINPGFSFGFFLFFFLLLPLYLLISFYYFIYFLFFSFFFTIFIVVFLSFWGHCILHNNLCITLLFSDVSLYKKRTLNKFISFKYDQLKLLIETKLDI